MHNRRWRRGWQSHRRYKAEVGEGVEIECVCVCVGERERERERE